MRNKLLSFLRAHSMVKPGETVICAVSGGADSMALLWAMCLLQEQLEISVEAAHFNHNLRGEESLRDAEFVAAFCKDRGIVLHWGEGSVTAGQKGLEAAAREARYAFLESLPGKIATAHTADDNAETLLMHLIRGTGLKGLGGISPVRGNIIRPMLTVTRQEVLRFLEEEKITYVTDSSNETDAFLRNRIRHRVMPILTEENPSIAENLSATALRLRLDEEVLEDQAELTTDAQALRQMPRAVQTRALRKLLLHFGVKEPEAEHTELLRKILYSDNPSSRGVFPGNVTIAREYESIIKLEKQGSIGSWKLNNPGTTEIPPLGIRVICGENDGIPLCAKGSLLVRSRRDGDTIRLSCGTKRLKKLFIDKKIPAHHRDQILVVADETGILMIPELNLHRVCEDAPNCRIRIETI